MTAGPRPRRTYEQTLTWVAWALLAVWSATAVLFGGYELVARAIYAHRLDTAGSWQNPLPPTVGPSMWLLWLLATVNVAPAGLVVGMIAVTRQRAARLVRLVLLPLLVVGAAVAEFAAPSLTSEDAVAGQDFVHDGRLAALLVVLTALVVSGVTYWLLPVLQQPAVSDSGPTGDKRCVVGDGAQPRHSPTQ